MPRPGPRPYECIRRAWHSDKFQPMRGSIIQEIFRVVSEIHTSTTKKNKEWQEKLPIVVLKAEEIMYSKANSEGEYKDLNTLLDRLNEAIDTIIRREENHETGDSLQPCIEAALVLGCTPRKATRSQRNSNPRCYLSPNAQEEPTSSLPYTDSSSPLQPSISQNPTSTPRFVSSYSNRLSSEFNSHYDNPSTSHEFSHSSHHLSPPGNPQSFPAEILPLSPNYGIYPLYYPSIRHYTDLPTGLQARQSSNSNTVVLVGTPVVEIPSIQSALEPTEKCLLQNLFLPDAAVNVSNRINQPDLRGALEAECDLSLRL
ncbi:hypothetical protein GIB67_037415 [Kingdonia uniflora]|uniref:Uncharacterized protein n=1 Tax=Kingdonia uniflora TaxID=39325 RepID=A0A7J7M8J1_9MAGN|nr:hypothetical protein GIB67_037415 [Kingdonia uniflora]